MEIIPRQIKTYGYVPDIGDHRDHEFTPLLKAVRIPDRRDLRHDVTLPILDQKTLGSCVGHGVASLDQFVQIKQKKSNPFLPSRLFIYYGAREYLRTVNQDSGAMIRDGIKVVAKLGGPPESLWPYQISRFRDQPSELVYIEAEKHQAIDYQRIEQSLYGLTACIAEGYPFVFGFSVYDNFESNYVTLTGDLQLPKPGENLLGGHAVLALSYNKKQKKFLCQNSWGEWGFDGRGFFTIPFDYILNENLADDFWTIRAIE